MELKKKNFKILQKFLFKMIIIFLLSGIISFSSLKITPIKGVKEEYSLDEFTNHLDDKIAILMKVYKIPGVTISLIDDGHIVWSNAYGFADVENNRSMTVDTYLRVQSISKSVTAWGVMKLVQEGKIELDKPVVTYLKNWEFPESKYSEEEVTIRQLLSHTAGLPLGNIFNYYLPKEDKPDLKDTLYKEAILINNPGDVFYYSNTGYNLLELLIEEVTGQKFADYMKNEILLPLGMENSSFTWSENLKPEVPNGYNLEGKSIPVYVYPEKGSGGLFATVEDIAKFVIAGMSDYNEEHNVLNVNSINELYKINVNKIGIYSLVFNGYGLGHYIEYFKNGYKAVSHGGQGTGWMSHFHFVPQKGDGIVILANSQRSWPLISYILRDWTNWNGYSNSGMVKIIFGKNILSIVVFIIWFASLLELWNIIAGFTSKRYKITIISKIQYRSRIIKGIFSLVIIIGILWCINQDYLFMSSIFPIAFNSLLIALTFFAITLLLSAMTIKIRNID